MFFVRCSLMLLLCFLCIVVVVSPIVRCWIVLCVACCDLDNAFVGL